MKWYDMLLSVLIVIAIYLILFDEPKPVIKNETAALSPVKISADPIAQVKKNFSFFILYYLILYNIYCNCIYCILLFYVILYILRYIKFILLLYYIILSLLYYII